MSDHTMDDIISKLSTVIFREHAGPDILKDNTLEFRPVNSSDPDLDGVFEIHQLKQETPTVDRMLNQFNKQWEDTAAACIRRAEELEGAALDLRERANELLNSLELTAAVKHVVHYEIYARNRALSLALVNPKEDSQWPSEL